MRRRATIAVLLALLTLTAGCGAGTNSGAPMGGDGGGSGGDGGEAPERGDAGDEGAPLEAQSGGSADSAGSGSAATGEALAAAQVNRALIRTGTVSLEVEEFDAARRNVTDAVRERGGYVSDSTERTNGPENATWSSGQVVLRVPSENFSGLFGAVQAEGEVLESKTGTEDVTDQVVDLEARLSNLRAERDRLRDLYRRANTTEDVLAVQRELSDVQSEVERTEAKLQSLRERVAYSTLTVEFRETRPEATFAEPTQWYDVGLVDAFLESVSGVGVTLRALLVAGAYVAPYALAFGLPLLVVVAVVRRRTDVRVD